MFPDLKDIKKRLVSADASGDEVAYKSAARDLKAAITNTRERELMARALLIHPESIPGAAGAELEALGEYIARQGWRSLWRHDSRMYRVLRACAENYQRENCGASDVNESPIVPLGSVKKPPS
jgi:hypothetical protein